MALRSLSSIITALSLTTGLKLCLDMGDISCVGTTGDQTLLDTSGGAFNFIRGATTGSSTDDPTINGTPGNLSINEFLSYDGGDVLNAASLPSWNADFHKDNAKFGIIACVKRPAAASGYLTGTFGGATSNIGFGLSLASTGVFSIVVGRGGGSALAAVNSPSGAVSPDIQSIIGVSLDESVGANGGFLFYNGQQQLFTSTYSSPSASAAAQTIQIGGRGGNSNLLTNGMIVYWIAIWTGYTPTLADFQKILAESGLRVGLAPEPRLLMPLDSGFSPDLPGRGSLEFGMV